MELSPESLLQIAVLGGGGFGGGGDGNGPDLLALLLTMVFALALFAFIGLLGALAVHGVVGEYIQSLRDKPFEGAAKSVAKDATIRIVDPHAVTRSRAAVAVQGAVTAVLTAVLQRILIG